MKRLLACLSWIAFALSLLVAGCAQPTTAPVSTPLPASTRVAEPVQASPTPTRAAEPAKAAESPAKKVDFPQKGKTITVIVPYPAGGGTDVPARLLTPMLERELGVPVQVVNKPGASSQVGVTELAKSKPDGYTLGYTSLPPVITIYLDPERKSAFTRKDLLPLALHNVDPGAVAVRADSPYKAMKDLVDAAKAKPRGLKSGTEGLMGEDHLATLQFEKLTGVEFVTVHFDGGAPANTALAGGHIDVRFSKVATLLPMVKSGQFRVLGIMDKVQSKHYPGVKTLEEQGYKLYWGSNRGISLPASTPREIVELLSAAIKKGVESEEHKQKMDELGFTTRYMDPEQFAAYWDEIETIVRPLMDLVKK